MSTVEQAQVFLGVDDKTPDDFIITMYTAKVRTLKIGLHCEEINNRLFFAGQ